MVSHFVETPKGTSKFILWCLQWDLWRFARDFLPKMCQEVFQEDHETSK